MKKILEYKLIANKDPEKFEKLVNFMIQNGWQPYGSGYSALGNGQHLVQPMVIYKENRTRPLPK